MKDNKQESEDENLLEQFLEISGDIDRKENKEDFFVCEHHQSTGGYESCCPCSEDGICTEAKQ